jgi:hypothetical protein
MKFQNFKNFQDTEFELLKYLRIDEGKFFLRCVVQDEKDLVFNTIVFYILSPSIVMSKKVSNIL